MNNYKILVAESDSNYIKMISDALKKRGYEVYQATDSASVLRVSRSVLPHLIIMDVNLSGNSAYKIARIIEKDKVSNVIFTTNNINSAFYEKLKSMNLFAYIIKPINLDQLYQTVEFSINNISKFKDLQNKIESLQNKLESRKNVERAKGIVMNKLKVSEEDAYKYLRKKSMDLCVSLNRISEQIIKKYGE